MRLYLHRIVLRRPWLAFLSMGLALLCFWIADQLTPRPPNIRKTE